MIDFSNCALSDHFYGGTEKKLGIYYSGFKYMLKFRKYTDFGPCYNHISEYIGSHVFDLLGFEVQDTFLGKYNGEEVVACKDFILENEQFVPFNDVGESSLEQDKEKYRYTYSDIIKMLEENTKLTNVTETIESFWEIFIVDALLGNFDRHGANWGFIKKDNKYRLAPVFDNGSCLYPKLNDEDEMEAIMSSEEKTNERIYNFPTSQIKMGHTKSSYYDVIHSLQFSECNKALNKICPIVDLNQINEIIDTCEIADVHKCFYKYIIKQRYEKILLESYKLLKK